jgi:hypothetical protein
LVHSNKTYSIEKSKDLKYESNEWNM